MMDQQVGDAGLRLNRADNVAVAIRPLRAGDEAAGVPVAEPIRAAINSRSPPSPRVTRC